MLFGLTGYLGTLRFFGVDCCAVTHALAVRAITSRIETCSMSSSFRRKGHAVTCQFAVFSVRRRRVHSHHTQWIRQAQWVVPYIGIEIPVLRSSTCAVE